MISRTSQIIATSLIYAGGNPNLKPYMPEEDVLLLQQRLGLCSSYAKLSFAAGWIERIFLPGIIAHYVIRKLILRRMAEETIVREDIKRCLILGAGLDLLGRHLARTFPAVAVCEFDQAASVTMKKMLLGPDVPPNFDFFPIDLRTRSDFASDVPTLVIAEGVLMYLSPEQVRDFFRSLHGRSHVLFTCMEKDEDNRIRFRDQNPLIEGWLRRSGEPFLWGTREEELRSLLAETGFDLTSFIASADYAAEHRLIARPARGENVCAAYKKAGPKLEA